MLYFRLFKRLHIRQTESITEPYESVLFLQTRKFMLQNHIDKKGNNYSSDKG